MISLAFAIIVTTICEIDGTILTRIFTNNQDVIKNGALYLKTYSIDCLLTSFLFCINGYLNGYEKTVFTMVHSLVATFIGRIPLTLLFSKIPNVTLFHMGITAPLSTMISLKAGQGMVQGIFFEFGIVEDDDVTEERNGGFGSTTK